MSHLSNVWTKATELVVATGSGARIKTVEGDEYLDFTAGIATANTGHSHPTVVAAITEQAQRIMHAQVNVVTHDLLNPLADKLAEITPDGIDKFFFSNSGAEIAEAAVKLAKQATKRPNVIVFSGSFHGRTHLAMAMTTSKSLYRAGHQPLPAGVFPAPFPDPMAEDQSEAIRYCLRAFDRILATQTSPSETAAVVMEPILGEGGYIPAPRDFIEGIAARCRELDILFVADEVQTGFGRTGDWFAVNRLDVQPDILMMGKGVASGFPFSALGLRADLDELWPQGSHGGTYGGNPMGCAAALATIEVMSEPGFFDNVNSRGSQLKDGINRLKEIDNSLMQVRGPGLMVAAAFDNPARVPAVIDHCYRESKLLLLSCGTSGSVIRFMPPLIVNEADIDEAIAAVGAALKATG